MKPQGFTASPDDGRDVYTPDCDVWIEISAEGVPTYYAKDTSPETAPVEVSAEVWRDLATVAQLGEFRQIRRILTEIGDSDVEGTISNTLRRIWMDQP